MVKRTAIIIAALALAAFAASGVYGEGKFWDFPPLPQPYQYGNILINRTSEKHDVKPVTFSHWSHRLRYTCRVCHFELEFQFKTNSTEITEEDCRNGLYCGACHDGDTAFGHTEENCNKCHTGDIIYGQKKFRRVWKKLPGARYGNMIDWVKARKITRPKYSIYTEEKPIRFTKTLKLQAEWALVPPAIFPHSVHVRFLDCSNCHPDVFNIKKKSTEHFRMDYILQSRFCGVCHLKVAFPLNDCKRCHPGIKEG